MIARQSTATTFMIGPVLDADGVAVTDCVVGDFKISKGGGAPAALNGSSTLTHRHTGFYSLAAAAGDFDTVGLAQFTIDDTTNSCAPVCFNVVEEAVFDSLFAASAAGYQVPIWSSASATVNLSGTTVKTATDVEADTADIQSRIPAALTANGNMKSSLLEIISTALTEGAAGRIAAAWQGFWNVTSPVANAQSVNQTGDAYAQTNQLVNGSAWVEMFGPRQVGIPQSGSRTHRVFFAVRNGRGALTAATSLSVFAATDLAGNNVAANCSAFTTVLTGIYYLDYTVANTHAETIVSVFVTGVANSSALYFQCGFAVGRFDAEDELIRYDPPTNAEMEARTLEAADYATAAALTAAPAEVITLLGSGTEVYGHSYLESIKRIEVVSGAATLSGAGTGTEVMTSSDSSKTATFTVDGSGNVSAVVWS